MYAAVNELLLRKQALEDELSISDIEAVQVLGLDLVLCRDAHAVKLPQLRNVKEHLETVVLAILHWVAAHVKLGDQSEILNECKLAYLADVVQLNAKEPETLTVLKTLKLLNLVLGEVESVQSRQFVEACDLPKTVLLQVELLKKQPIKVLDGVDGVAVQRQDPEAAVGLEALDLLNVVLVKVEVLEVGIAVSVLYLVYRVAAVVDPLEVGGRLEVKRLPKLVV